MAYVQNISSMRMNDLQPCGRISNCSIELKSSDTNMLYLLKVQKEANQIYVIKSQDSSYFFGRFGKWGLRYGQGIS